MREKGRGGRSRILGDLSRILDEDLTHSLPPPAGRVICISAPRAQRPIQRRVIRIAPGPVQDRFDAFCIPQGALFFFLTGEGRRERERRKSG